MRRVAYQEQARTIPLAQPVHLDREQFYRIPILQLSETIRAKRCDRCEGIAKRLQASSRICSLDSFGIT
jgi:hypothetical protein